MGTHRRFRRCHKVLNLASDEEIISENVTMECFKAQTKLPSHVEAQEAQNRNRSDLQHSCTLFRRWFKFVLLRNALYNN